MFIIILLLYTYYFQSCDRLFSFWEFSFPGANCLKFLSCFYRYLTQIQPQQVIHQPKLFSGDLRPTALHLPITLENAPCWLREAHVSPSSCFWVLGFLFLGLVPRFMGAYSLPEKACRGDLFFFFFFWDFTNLKMFYPNCIDSLGGYRIWGLQSSSLRIFFKFNNQSLLTIVFNKNTLILISCFSMEGLLFKNWARIDIYRCMSFRCTA